jgi:hypothetical protein
MGTGVSRTSDRRINQTITSRRRSRTRGLALLRIRYVPLTCPQNPLGVGRLEVVKSFFNNGSLTPNATAAHALRMGEEPSVPPDRYYEAVAALVTAGSVVSAEWLGHEKTRRSGRTRRWSRRSSQSSLIRHDCKVL